MKKILDKKEWIIIVLLIIVLILIPFIIGGAVKVHEGDKPISIDNWLIYYATIGGALIGGFITTVGLYITIRQTREIQNENRKDIEKQMNLEKNFKQIEYLKEFYSYSYKYERYVKNKLEDILNELYWLNDEFHNNESDNSEFDNIDPNNNELGLIIKEKSIDVIDTLENLSRDIIIQSASVQSKEIKKLVKSIISFDEDMIGEVMKVIEDGYSQEEIPKMFSDEDGIFSLVIQLLIALNVEVYNEIKRMSC